MKAPRTKLLGRVQDLPVYLVDGEAIRNEREIEFTTACVPCTRRSGSQEWSRDLLCFAEDSLDERREIAIVALREVGL